MSAFDVLAPDYDEDFTHSAIGTTLRRRVHSYLLNHFKAGDSVLELGCGTGEDARLLSGHGIHITATDSSAGMLEVAQRKNADNSLIQFTQLDLNQPHLAATTQKFDGVFSNFGAINCVESPALLAKWLAPRVRSGGMVALGIMAPYCLWEIGWHLLHFDWQIAMRRTRGKSSFHPEGAAQPITIHYPAPQQLATHFSEWFDCISVRPLGLLLPPTALYPVVEKRRRLLETLTAWDEKLANVRILAIFADHYWIELRRK